MTFCDVSSMFFIIFIFPNNLTKNITKAIPVLLEMAKITINAGTIEYVKRPIYAQTLIVGGTFILKLVKKTIMARIIKPICIIKLRNNLQKIVFIIIFIYEN